MFLYALMTALLACNLPAAAAVSVGYEESINPPPVPPQPLDLLESVLYSASETAPDVPVSRRSDYTGEDRSVIIGEHNRHRRQVTPTAANMNVLKWDAELAAMAQGWSDQCFFEHGNPENTSPFGYVGQNLYIRYYSKAGQPAPSAAVPIQKWYDEASQYKYADRSCSGVCGHYTQCVSGVEREGKLRHSYKLENLFNHWLGEQLLHVGCGQTYCETALDNNGKTYNNAWLITCNYGPGGNYKGQFPYQEGEKCSKCDSPGTCKGGLCRDCDLMEDSACICGLQCEIVVSPIQPTNLVKTLIDTAVPALDGRAKNTAEGTHPSPRIVH
ncbi:hypothetical protein BSL78_26229 [Apostichopus japonicus]|uniref:SCP domain-containing protein n=1 Tax=Stichopus japonicus TaxID=307972 RepID=A0A2G8JME1_STIJA|nr:hypothetical protein BSL78_26229 [Apostichopus japonicus]